MGSKVLKEVRVVNRSKIGKNSKAKGGNLERKLMQFFRDELGYKFCKTSRNASKQVDDCGIDLYGIPYNIQTKCGYVKARPKADELFKNMKIKLQENFSPEDPIHNFPRLLVHKIDERKEENMLVTMTYTDWCSLMIELHNLRRNENKNNTKNL